MLLEIEGVIALIVGAFVFSSMIKFIKSFYKDTNLAISRIKLSPTTPKAFILFLLSNLVLLILYSLSAGQDNIKYGLLGVILYTAIFGYFFFMLYRIVSGRRLNLT